MVVRIKMKTFLKILFIFFVVLGIAYFFIPRFYSIETPSGIVTIKEINNPKALYWTAMKRNPGSDPMLYISPGFTNSSNVTDTEGDQLTDQQAIHYLERLITEYPSHQLARDHGKWNLALLYQRVGEIDKAKKLYYEIIEEKNQHQQEAKQRVMLLEPTGEQISLSGNVMIGDTPADYIYVYLIKRTSDNFRVFPPGPDNTPTTITNARGEYRFYDVDPGQYEIGVGLQREKVNGFYWPLEYGTYLTITEESSSFDIQFVPQVKVISPSDGAEITGDNLVFQWQAYPGAAYYQLFITGLERDEKGNIIGSYSNGLPGKWMETTANYSVEDIRSDERSIGKSGTEESNGLGIASILGAVYPGGEFTWYVEAYDNNGKRISSSAGYYTLWNDIGYVPLFSMDANDQLEGDRLIMSRQYEDAIQAYKENLDNPHALRALAIMSHYGIYFDDDGDKNKSLEYLIRIQNPSAFDLRMMAEAYAEIGKTEEAKQIYKKIIESAPENFVDRMALANILRKEADFERAISLYEQVLEIDANQSSSDELVLLYLLQKNVEKALEIAKNYPYKYYTYELYPLLKEAAETGIDDPLFTQGLEAIARGDKELAQQSITKLRDIAPSLSKFLQALQKEVR